MMYVVEMCSDKGVIVIKMRIVVVMIRDEYIFKDGEIFMYEKVLIIINVDKYVVVIKEYKEFLD